MQIKFDPEFESSFIRILDFIATDKLSASTKFQEELHSIFDLLKENPYMFKASRYFESDKYRDLIYKGYTIVYKITENEILVLEIFKWTDR